MIEVREESVQPKRRFRVVTLDDPATAEAAMKADGIPQLGDEWKPYGLFCISQFARPLDNSHVFWEVICRYGLQPPAADANTPGFVIGA